MDAFVPHEKKTYIYPRPDSFFEDPLVGMNLELFLQIYLYLYLHFIMEADGMLLRCFLFHFREDKSGRTRDVQN